MHSCDCTFTMSKVICTCLSLQRHYKGYKGSGECEQSIVGLTAGWQADEIRLDYAIVNNPLQVELFGFLLVDSIAVLLIVLEVHFNLLFSNKRILGCILWCIKFGCHFFMLIPTIRY